MQHEVGYLEMFATVLALVGPSEALQRRSDVHQCGDGVWMMLKNSPGPGIFALA